MLLRRRGSMRKQVGGLLPLISGVFFLLGMMSALLPGGGAVVTQESIASEGSTVLREDSVLVLGADTLDGALEEHRLLMLNFYAPWCSYCKQLAPEYTKAAMDLQEDGLPLGKGCEKLSYSDGMQDHECTHPALLSWRDPSASLGLSPWSQEINCDEDEELCAEDRWDIDGFPAIKLVASDTVHDYTGARMADGITAFMREVASFGRDSEEDPEDGSEDSSEDKDDVPEMEYEEENGLLILGANNLQAAAEEFVLMMVMFHSSEAGGGGCGEECLAMSEACVAAGEELYDYAIPLAKVDCQLHKELCEQPYDWSVATAELPALKVYRDGEFFDYLDRPVTAQGIVDFMKALAGIGG